ncbi:MAG: C40 family peptidase [Clostridium sp.]|jgi:cell wall-associated NlpC family hydrolase|nr:C40 family peptidase [Clostridium sp.]
MKKKAALLALIMTIVGVTSKPYVVRASSSSITQIGEQIKQTQEEIDAINEEIIALQDQQDLLEEMIADLNAEIVNTMTSIGMKEDEIAAKVDEIAYKEQEILSTQTAYEAAKLKEEEQYVAMKKRVKYSYENDSNSIWGFLLGSRSLGDMLNRIDYLNEIHEHDENLLREYENTKETVQNLWDELVVQKQTLLDEKASLEQDREALATQKAELEILLEQKRKDSANYDAEISAAQKQAKEAQNKLKQEQAQYKKLQEEERRRNSAANQTYKTTNYTSIIDQANGSDLGKKVAKYGCQFIGNPYVMGGTSLTKGADCSGFIYRIYMDFGYTISRTSSQQRSVGTGVSYDQAQPGDIICYDGHVGIYIGGGKIVHASSARTGIKVSNATYRPILAVRRVI